MKIAKKMLIIIFSVLLICFSISIANAKTESTNDESVISAQQDSLTPLYTKAADSSTKNYPTDKHSVRDYQLFYTQTTFLALIAGYLIIFKVKGVNLKKEKMHGNGKNLKE